jgi:hypothetical protein
LNAPTGERRELVRAAPFGAVELSVSELLGEYVWPSPRLAFLRA